MMSTEDGAGRAGFTRRGFLQGAGVSLAGAAGLQGVGALLHVPGLGAQQALASAAPRRGGNLIEGINSDPESLNPLLAATNVGVLTTRLLFESLLSLDSDGQLEPALAEDLPNVSDDGLTYTFTLRPDLQWSDGTPLTAGDVVFTFNLLHDPEYADFTAFLRSLATDYIDTVSSPDDQTIVIATKQVYAPFALTFGLTPILPSAVLGSLSGVELNTADFNTAPNPVSGVFALSGDGWTAGSQILYERNPYYFRGESLLDNYAIRILTDATVLATAVRSGDVDIAGAVEYSQIASLEEADNLTVNAIPSDETTVVGFQLREDKPASQFFADKNVRQALCYALDRASMIDAAEFGQATLTNSVEPPSSWAFEPNVTPVYDFDPERAAEMLDAAGWVVGESGFREKDGTPFAFELLTDNNHADHVTIAEIVQQQWGAIGLDVSVRLVAFTELIDTLILSGEHDFDSFIIGFNVNGNSPEPDQSNFWLSTSTANIPGFANPEVDDLLNRGLEVVDQAERTPIYQEFQQVLADEVPALPLWFLNYAWAINNRVGGFDVNQFQQLGSRTWMKDVFVQ
jgi:peptide/nickel transport system substrate-binding protein